MTAENSGHSGPWTVGETNDFNNQYFKVSQNCNSEISSDFLKIPHPEILIVFGNDYLYMYTKMSN